MPPRVRMSLAVMMLVFLLIPALALYRELSRRSDIWWTPQALLVPLSESSDRVEVYVRGKRLISLLQAGQLRTTGDAPSNVLTTSDIGFRFNNWDRVRAQQRPLLLWSAAVIGAGAVVFLLLISGRLAYRGEREGASQS